MNFYGCKTCNSILHFMKNDEKELICCGHPMEVLKPNVGDGAKEKHIPAVIQEENKVSIQVGSVPHPMLDIHYIEWIILETQRGFYGKWLQPNEEPKAEFVLTGDEQIVSVYEYCNIHGLWRK